MVKKAEMEAGKDTLIEEDLLEILAAAIQDEKVSQDRYQRALKEARSPESRALFQELIQQERHHQELLEERYDQIKKKLEVKIIGKWSRWVKAGAK